MNIETLEAKIKTRANERVQDRIRQFKKALDAALTDLFSARGGTCSSLVCGYALSEPYRRVLAVCAGDDIKHCWPAELWACEEDRLRKELLGIMDEMQKTLLSRPVADGAVAEPELKKEPKHE